MIPTYSQLIGLVQDLFRKPLIGQKITHEDVEAVATQTIHFLTKEGEHVPPFAKANEELTVIPYLSSEDVYDNSKLSHLPGAGGGVRLDGVWMMGSHALTKTELWQPGAHAANRYETALKLPKGNFGKVTLEVRIRALGQSMGLIQKIFVFDANSNTGAHSQVAVAYDDILSKVYVGEPDWIGSSILIPIHETAAVNVAKIYVIETAVVAGATFMTPLLAQAALLEVSSITARSAALANTVTLMPNTQMSVTSDASGLKLANDSAIPGNSKMYGTDAAGAKGWQNQSDVLVAKQMSIDRDSSGLKLVNDATTPGNSKVYGTDAAGAKGWQNQSDVLVAKQMSIDRDASGLKLVNDATTPGNSKVYGTDAAGAKGWQNQSDVLVAKQMSIDRDASGLKLLNDATTPGNNKMYGTDAAGAKGWQNQSQMSIDRDASGLKLVNDSATPGNNKMYGTDAAGAKGWQNQSQMSIDRDASGLKLVNDATTPGNSKVYGTDAAGAKGWQNQADVLVAKQMSIDRDGSGLKLINDAATPGNNKMYGTDGSGTKGWQNQSQMSIDRDGSGLKLVNDVTTPSASQFYGTNGSGVRGWQNQSALLQDFDLVTKTITYAQVVSTTTKTQLVDLAGPGALGSTQIAELRLIGEILQQSGVANNITFEMELVTNAGTSTQAFAAESFANNANEYRYKMEVWAYRESTNIVVIGTWTANRDGSTVSESGSKRFTIASASSISNMRINVTLGASSANLYVDRRLAWVRLI